MKAFGNKVFLEVDFEENNKTLLGEKEIYIDTSRDNTRRLRVMRGRVYSAPDEFSKKYNISTGDILYCHHYLTDESSRVEIEGKTLCFISSDLVFFRLNKDGSMDPFNNYILVKPVLEREENYISKSGIMLKPTPNEIPLVGDVIAVSKDVPESKIKKGDRIRFSPNSDYDIYVGGNKIYKMRASNLDIDYIFNNKEDCYDQEYK